MKLQILIPRYRESKELINPLLSSIAAQQGISFDDIGVIIMNDGDYDPLPQEYLDSFPYRIDYYIRPHAGIPGARNALLDLAEAPYIMYCDDDDMFYNLTGLRMIFEELRSEPDLLNCSFLEETIAEDGKVVFIRHEPDGTFIHGKVYKREFLLRNNIRWNEELPIHEDIYFNGLVCGVAHNKRYFHEPFYLWKFNPGSVTRSQERWGERTYTEAIKGNRALVEELCRREKNNYAARIRVSFVIRTYYAYCDAACLWRTDKELWNRVRAELLLYLRDTSVLNGLLTNRETAEEFHRVRGEYVAKGLLAEPITYDDWARLLEEETE